MTYVDGVGHSLTCAVDHYVDTHLLEERVSVCARALSLCVCVCSVCSSSWSPVTARTCVS